MLDNFKDFDEGLKVRGVFLDISKTFDKVWYKGLIYNYVVMILLAAIYYNYS